MKTLGIHKGYSAAYLERKVKEAREEALRHALKVVREGGMDYEWAANKIESLINP